MKTMRFCAVTRRCFPIFRLILAFEMRSSSRLRRMRRNRRIGQRPALPHWRAQVHSTQGLTMIQRTMMRRLVESSPLLALTLLCACPLVVRAQEASTCAGPAALEQALASKPSPGAYEALGSWFATQRKFTCATSAFESAIRLDPNSWQSHYDLG